MMEREMDVATAQQCLGMDFALSQNWWPGARPMHHDGNFACIAASVHGRQALVFVHTCMYPTNYDEAAHKQRQYMLDWLKVYTDDDAAGLDLYMLGIGAIKKNAVNEADKGRFVPGERYLISLQGPRLIRRRAGDNFGYADDEPVQLTDISDEYLIMRRLRHKYGQVVNPNRLGSTSGARGGILDLWEVQVEDGPLRYSYEIYLDPYALNNPDDVNLAHMPEGFFIRTVQDVFGV